MFSMARKEKFRENEGILFFSDRLTNIAIERISRHLNEGKGTLTEEEQAKVANYLEIFSQDYGVDQVGPFLDLEELRDESLFFRFVVSIGVDLKAGKQPKQILQEYVDQLRDRYEAHKLQNKDKLSKRIRSFFLGKTVNNLLSFFRQSAKSMTTDPVPQVAKYAVDPHPNCIQVSVVLCEAFKLFGIDCEPYNYSTDNIPHVGIHLKDADTVLFYKLTRNQNYKTGLRVVQAKKDAVQKAKYKGS